MKIAMIAAMTKDRVIGLNGDMPWHLPDDLKFFKANTTGKPVIMGRKTFESIGSRPLPNRPNVVISRNSDLVIPNVEVFQSVEQALEKYANEPEVIIMGGGEIYRQMLPKADCLYLTLIDAKITGDTFFPDWTAYKWTEIERQHHTQDEKHAYAFDFLTLERRQ
jgi:dihydrofolate reductase